MSEQEKFDMEQVHDEQIFPLMERLIAICKEHRIPMVASFNYANREDRDDGTGGLRFSTTHLHWPERSPENYHYAVRAIRNNPHFAALTITTAVKP